MRKISFWAKSHPRIARMYIIVIKILLAFMAWFVGRSISEMDISVPESIGFLTLFVFIGAALLILRKAVQSHPVNIFTSNKKAAISH
jgi:hypothetical protein